MLAPRTGGRLRRASAAFASARPSALTRAFLFLVLILASPLLQPPPHAAAASPEPESESEPAEPPALLKPPPPPSFPPAFSVRLRQHAAGGGVEGDGGSTTAWAYRDQNAERIDVPAQGRSYLFLYTRGLAYALYYPPIPGPIGGCFTAPLTEALPPARLPASALFEGALEAGGESSSSIEHWRTGEEELWVRRSTTAGPHDDDHRNGAPERGVLHVNSPALRPSPFRLHTEYTDFASGQLRPELFRAPDAHPPREERAAAGPPISCRPYPGGELAAAMRVRSFLHHSIVLLPGPPAAAPKRAAVQRGGINAQKDDGTGPAFAYSADEL